MREPNLGVTRFCDVCGSSFWCEDGDSVCSKPSCQREAYNPRCDECDMVLEHETFSGLCDDCEAEREEQEEED